MGLTLAACQSPAGPLDVVFGVEGVVGHRTVQQYAEEGGASPAPIVVNIRNGTVEQPANCPLSVTVQTTMVNSQETWISAPVGPHTIAPAQSYALTISFSTENLAPGLYTASIVLRGTCLNNGRPAAGSPFYLSVNLAVRRVRAVQSPDTEAIVSDVPLLANTWSVMSGSPPGRERHVAVWTGQVMLIWGGFEDPVSQAPTSQGYMYFPDNGAWYPINTDGAPVPVNDASAVWHNGEMIVFGGVSGGVLVTQEAHAYNPATDQWRRLPQTGTPPVSQRPIMVSTGTEVLVLSSVFNSGQLALEARRLRTNPDSWEVIDPAGGPIVSYLSRAVWTGGELIVTGFLDGQSGYPVTNRAIALWGSAWVPLGATTLTPGPGRGYHVMEWTGRDVLVLTGGPPDLRWNAGTNVWSALSPGAASDAPDRDRTDARSVWTGREAVVWGGVGGTGVIDTGYIVDGQSGQYRAVSSVGAPPAQWGHTMVFTGEEVLLFGFAGGYILR
jgi:hypothetical protein